MNKLYYLSSCSTCKKIIKQWSLNQSISLIDVKKNSIDEKALKELFEITNSYEALFNKRAQLLKKLNLNSNELKEKDFMIHTPYHKFSYIISFLMKSSIDPKVKKISITTVSYTHLTLPTICSV